MRRLYLHLYLSLGMLAGAGQVHAQAQWKAFSTPGGQPPLPLNLTSITGKKVDLASFRGQVVVINFWATWCEPCRDEMPSMNRLQKKLGGKNLQIVGINAGEGLPRIEEFLQRIPVDFTVLRDPGSETMKAWRVRILPSSFLVDKNGMLRYQLVGEADWDDPAIQEPILELIK